MDSMDRWQTLFGQAAAAVELEQQSAAWRRALQSDARALTKWSADAANELMVSVRARASERGEVLAREVDLSVLVIGPDWSTVSGVLVGVVRLIGPGGESSVPSQTRPTVALAGDEVQIYAHLPPGQMPTVQHLVPGDSGWVRRTRHRRWVTFPFARLGCAQDGRPILVSSGSSQRIMTTDDVVFRAFELLLRPMIHRATPRDLRPAPCPPNPGIGSARCAVPRTDPDLEH